MNTHELTHVTVAAPTTTPAHTESPAQAAEGLQKSGTRLIFAGFAVTILGVVLYCAVCFAGSVDADLADILLRDAVPFGRATLGVLGVGTLMWLVGSFRYLRGLMDAEPQDDAPKEQR